MKNIQIAKLVNKKLIEKNINIDFQKLLEFIDNSITYQNDYEIDENGNIIEISNNQLLELINNLTDGIVIYIEERVF